MAEYAFSELGLHRLTASAFETNEASKRVLKRIGFVKEGVSRQAAYVDGDWCDLIRYGLLREEWVRT
jgi:ribosomal-protein-alanine N-acetyltransferase